MKKNKRFVTRQFYFGKNRVWNIWDKVECKWMTELGFFTREGALMIADKMNKKES